MKFSEQLESLERTVAYEDPDQMYSHLNEAILDKLSEPIKFLLKELKVAEKQV